VRRRIVIVVQANPFRDPAAAARFLALAVALRRQVEELARAPAGDLGLVLRAEYVAAARENEAAALALDPDDPRARARCELARRRLLAAGDRVTARLASTLGN
jgi:hypothetical protein